MKKLLFLIFLATEARADTVANTILAEARGEGFRGMYAVAAVIKNRSDLSGRTPEQECLRPKQFSCNNHGVQNLLDNSKESRYALFLSRNLELLDASGVNGATHYHSGPAPKWAKGKKPVLSLHGHKFYRLP